MAIEQDMDALAERTLQLAIVAQRLDERSEDAVRSTERAANEVSSAAARLGNVGERVAREAVEAIGRDAAAYLEQAASRAFAQAGSALDGHAVRLRELNATLQASSAAMARSHRRWLVVAPALAIAGSLLAVGAATLWVAQARGEVERHRIEAGLLRAYNDADVTLCGGRLCVRVDPSHRAHARGYVPVAARDGRN
jgi:hypothetical protein